MKKAIFIALGFLCLGLGTIGVFLPVLPTVPLYLGTLFFFGKGSERFHIWFKGTKLYGKHLKNFAENRSISFEREILLLSSVSAMLLATMVIADVKAMYIVFPIIIASKYAYFILRVKPIGIGLASPSSRFIAAMIGTVLLLAIFVLNNLIITIAYSVIILTYIAYFGVISVIKAPVKAKDAD
jgi:uncharacterized membrane protein YbaN (DUF454 family)